MKYFTCSFLSTITELTLTPCKTKLSHFNLPFLYTRLYITIAAQLDAILHLLKFS